MFRFGDEPRIALCAVDPLYWDPFISDLATRFTRIATVYIVSNSARAVSFHNRVVARRSAIRVCQPGPVAFQRASTSAGSLIVMSLRGLDDMGLPPRFTLPRFNASLVSCGNSRYSFARILCASTRAILDFKVRGDALFLAVIGLPHAKNVSGCVSRGVSDYHHSASEQAVADNARFAVVFSLVFKFKCDSFKNKRCIFEIKPSLSESLSTFGRIEGYQRLINVTTETIQSNWFTRILLCETQPFTLSARAYAQYDCRRRRQDRFARRFPPQQLRHQSAPRLRRATRAPRRFPPLTSR